MAIGSVINILWHSKSESLRKGVGAFVWSSDLALFWAPGRRMLMVLQRIANSPVTGQRPPQGTGCNDGSIPRIPAGPGPAYARPHYLSLHIRPLFICSRFADRGLSVFVIEDLPQPPNCFKPNGSAHGAVR